MAYTDINSEDRLVQATFAAHLEKVLGWDSVYAWNQESFGPTGTDAGPLGRTSKREKIKQQSASGLFVSPREATQAP